jgi:hypothetical protein
MQAPNAGGTASRHLGPNPGNDEFMAEAILSR